MGLQVRYTMTLVVLFIFLWYQLAVLADLPSGETEGFPLFACKGLRLLCFAFLHQIGKLEQRS